MFCLVPKKCFFARNILGSGSSLPRSDLFGLPPFLPSRSGIDFCTSTPGTPGMILKLLQLNGFHDKNHSIARSFDSLAYLSSPCIWHNMACFRCQTHLAERLLFCRMCLPPGFPRPIPGVLHVVRQRWGWRNHRLQLQFACSNSWRQLAANNTTHARTLHPIC